MTHVLDAIDRRILRVLAEDARITWNDLASKVGLSVTPTLRRVRIMEKNGLIIGYKVILDERKLIGSIGVIIGITLDKQIRTVLKRFETNVANMPEVVFGALMSGSQDYLLKAFVRDLPHYQDLLERLTNVDGVAHIQSSFMIKAFVNTITPIPLEPEA